MGVLIKEDGFIEITLNGVTRGRYSSVGVLAEHMLLAIREMDEQEEAIAIAGSTLAALNASLVTAKENADRIANQSRDMLLLESLARMRITVNSNRSHRDAYKGSLAPYWVSMRADMYIVAKEYARTHPGEFERLERLFAGTPAVEVYAPREDWPRYLEADCWSASINYVRWLDGIDKDKRPEYPIH